MPTKIKFPLVLPPVGRQKKSAMQALAFGRMDLETTILFISDAGFADIATNLRQCLNALPPASVHHLGCQRCNGDVPLDQADLLTDRLCRPCADAYDAAVEVRRQAMRAARQQLKIAA